MSLPEAATTSICLPEATNSKGLQIFQRRDHKKIFQKARDKLDTPAYLAYSHNAICNVLERPQIFS